MAHRNKADGVEYPEECIILSSPAPSSGLGEVHTLLSLPTLALAEECVRRFHERWHPAGYGGGFTVKEGGGRFVVRLWRYPHCD